LLQNSGDGAKVGLNCAESFSESRQPLSRVCKRRRVKIHSDYASVSGGLQHCFAVSAKPNRAIHKETSSLRSEELQCLFKQHGAMGRASAPQKRSHHHRPVISFKDR
jgi:hypothetical protein